jgi:hypothetical protein
MKKLLAFALMLAIGSFGVLGCSEPAKKPPKPPEPPKQVEKDKGTTTQPVTPPATK